MQAKGSLAKSAHLAVESKPQRGQRQSGLGSAAQQVPFTAARLKAKRAGQYKNKQCGILSSVTTTASVPVEESLTCFLLFLFIYFYSAWTYTFSLECVFSVCSCRLCWHSSWVFFPIILSQAFVNLCDCVLECFFVSMLKECLGVSIYGKIWSDGMAAGWDLHSSNLHGLIREGTLRLSQLVVSHGLHPNRHQHYQILLYSPAMHMDCLNNLALLTGNVSLTETTQYFPILFVLISSWWRPEAERLLKGQRGRSRRMNR